MFFKTIIFHIEEKGFTLVETVVTVAIYLILMLSVFQGILTFYRYNAYSFAQAYQVSNARRGMNILVQDIREMTFADDGTYPLAIMQPNKIGFYSDVDRDNSVEYVEYRLATTTLKKYIYGATGNPPVYGTTPESVQTLSEFVQNLNQSTSTFYYYNSNGKVATSGTLVTDIMYIKSQIIVNIDLIRDPGQFMLRSSAALRNLKENL